MSEFFDKLFRAPEKRITKRRFLAAIKLHEDVSDDDQLADLMEISVIHLRKLKEKYETDLMEIATGIVRRNSIGAVKVTVQAANKGNLSAARDTLKMSGLYVEKTETEHSGRLDHVFGVFQIPAKKEIGAEVTEANKMKEIGTLEDAKRISESNTS